jgi:hypothetical protein
MESQIERHVFAEINEGDPIMVDVHVTRGVYTQEELAWIIHRLTDEYEHLKKLRKKEARGRKKR